MTPRRTAFSIDANQAVRAWVSSGSDWLPRHPSTRETATDRCQPKTWCRPGRSGARTLQPIPTTRGKSLCGPY